MKKTYINFVNNATYRKIRRLHKECSDIIPDLQKAGDQGIGTDKEDGILIKQEKIA